MDKPKIFTLAAALAALGTPAVQAAAPASSADDVQHSERAAKASVADANRFLSVGDDILSFTVTELADGTVLAQHRSHYSHSSHSSHRSHSSSRY